VLSFGASGDGAELLASRQMARVIRNIGRRFAERVVILDAPPCLASSDAAAMAPVVGQIVFVVEAEQTQRPEVEAALDLIQACPTITLLLNKVQLRARHTFGGYYSTYTYN
jgi:receptor protein-tyrosine kinase